VNLVDDVDLISSADRRKTDVVAKFAHLINAVIAGPIDLQNIKTDPLGNFSTGIADAARSYGRTVDAVQPFRQNPGS
jgi:hypothetical protein